ncbi:MAG: hypothetical protein EOM67_05065 [Spirochaetia bacterium]|nr:hypothetical protein [Spirochaetia bacterium]
MYSAVKYELLFGFFFGCDEELDPTALQEVTNFELTAGEVSLQLSWTNPVDSDFLEVEIFYKKEGEALYTQFLGVINPNKTIIHSLESEALYYVKIKCLYSNPQRITDGLERSKRVLNDDIPPDVTEVSFIEGNNSLTVRWTNPDIIDFDRVEIEYGFLLGEYTDIEEPLDSEGTLVDSLLRDSTYYFNFVVFDTQGKNSKGISEHASTFPYHLRDEGPSGGLIFYVDLSAPHGFKYLEAAPSAWKGLSRPTGPWATGTTAPGLDINYSQIIVNTTDTIYSGEENTVNMVAAHPNPSSFPFAADRCDQLIYNGADDWFLPSIEQLKAMYDNLHNIPSPVGNFDETTYWASVQASRATYAKTLDFDGKAVVEEYKPEAHTVRPVRAFSYSNIVSTPTITTNPEAPYSPGTTYTVTITCVPADAEIYYTTDGSEVSEESTLYSNPFTYTTLAESGPPIQAKGYKAHHDSSYVAVKEMLIPVEEE